MDAQNGFTVTNSYTYDYAGRLTSTTDALGNTSWTSYNWLGNAVSKTDPSGTSVTYTYDSFGRVLTETVPIDASLTKVTSYSYDNNGNKTQEYVHPLGSYVPFHWTKYTYNSRNLLTKVTQVEEYKDENDTPQIRDIVTAQYAYDPRGLIESSNAGGYITEYTYDSHGNLSSCKYPGETILETYEYYADGKIHTSTDRKGITKTYSYTATGNVSQISAGSQYIAYGYYKNGLLQYESDGTTTDYYSYDSLGRKISDGTASYAYDLNSNLISVTVGTDITTYSYDRAGRMTSVVNGLSTTNYAYNSRSLRTSVKNYRNSNLITQTDYAYNLAGLATSLVNKDGTGNTLSSFSYTYRFDGNIASETDHNGITTYYTYDSFGRLISEVGGLRTKYYTYDNAGNRTKAYVDIGNTITYNYNGKGQLVSETSTTGAITENTTYTYDANGNLTSKKNGIVTTTYTFDVWEK